MKATIEHVQQAPIPANVSERAVDLAAHTAQLAAEQDVVKAARATVRAALEADPDYKDAKKRKKELKKRIAPEVEEITALETAAKKLQTPREIALYRVSLNCKVGRDALEGIGTPIQGVTATQYALFCLLHAVEDIAKAMGEKE
jgi:hypothetical protein